MTPPHPPTAHAPPRWRLLARFRVRNPGRPIPALLLYEACWLLLWAFFSLVYRLRIRGDHLIQPPGSGPLLVVANHQSHLDPPCIGMAFRRRHLNFLARAGLFRAPPPFGLLIDALNAVPIKETGSDTAAIRAALDQLAAGRCLLIFPEGTRSPDGGVHPFKRGFWLLMSRARCPILPVAIEGAFDAFPRSRRFPFLWRRRLTITIGAPIPAERLLALGPDTGLPALRQLIDDLRGAPNHDRSVH